MRSSAPLRWNVGLALLMVPVFIGLLVFLVELPVWLDVVALVAIIALVFTGVWLLFRRQGGWQPSRTLPSQRPDSEH